MKKLFIFIAALLIMTILIPLSASNSYAMGQPPATHYRAGIQYSKDKNYDKAVEELKLVDKNNLWEYKDAQFELSMIYDLQGITDEALKVLDGIIADFPQQFDAYFGKGEIYLNSGSHQLALVEYEKGINILDKTGENVVASDLKLLSSETAGKVRIIDPRFAGIYLTLGQLYYENKRYKEALEQLSKGRSFYKNDEYLFIYVGQCQMYLGNYDQAMNEFIDGRAIYPTNGLFEYNIASVYSLKKDAKSALLALKKAVILDKKLKDNAKTDGNFLYLIDNDEFKKTVGL